ncbi:MAG: protease family protein [Acidobacteriota bacterium]|jgi:membrane protease YdiL (CAAX protease family)|nr:protease family protein [Acidobacteriota bacterium]
MLASKRHTVIVLLIFAVIAVGGYLTNARSSAAPAATSRLPLYVTVIVTQLLLVRYVAVGIHKYGLTIADLVGRKCPLDIVIGIAWFFVIRCASLVMWAALQLTDDHASGLLPRGNAEIAMWIVVSIVAGLCEELVFRGYLQRQLAVLTRSTVAGLVLQAMVFGVSHGYQGVKAVINITILGLLFGLVAQWRRSIVPGAIAHALTDIVGGLR